MGRGLCIFMHIEWSWGLRGRLREQLLELETAKAELFWLKLGVMGTGFWAEVGKG